MQNQAACGVNIVAMDSLPDLAKYKDWQYSITFGWSSQIWDQNPYEEGQDFISIS